MSRLGNKLVDAGLISAAELALAEREASSSFRPLPRVLAEDGFVDEDSLLPVLADSYGLQAIAGSELAVDPGVIAAVPAKLAAHYSVLPLSLIGKRLRVALCDPLDLSAVEDIETNLGYEVERVLAPRAAIQKGLRDHYGVGAATVERILADDTIRVRQRDTSEESHDLGGETDDASIIRLVNQLLHEAIVHRATDLHLEAQRAGMAVRRRIDGILYDAAVPRGIQGLFSSIVSRIKLMSGLNIVERRLPQDGRARVTIDDAVYDLRVSTVPALHGEDVVIRILPSTMLFDLPELGYSRQHLDTLEELISQPHGIIFVTGPTGSGKSTTLYACMSRLNSRQRKIITIEDPIEYELPGITQTQTNPKIGLSFARALRSMLRHDPDVMMVGEVRDRETAEIAIQTAMTGHLVLSTLHTNDAASGATRLIDMGIDPYLVTSTVEVFVAQRLVRTICPSCRHEVDGPQGSSFAGRGCPACNQTGYRGRVAICEFLPLRDEIGELILKKASAPQIRACADRLGIETLKQDGLRKVAEGITTLEEVMRVTSI